MISHTNYTLGHFQSLDLICFSALKKVLYWEYDLHLSNSGHQRITEYDVAEQFVQQGIYKVTTMDKSVSGFHTPEIYPLDSDKFNDEFALAN